MNLIGNAIKFTEVGEVRVSAAFETSDGSGRLCLAVSDTGVGIPEAQHETIFARFSQAERSTAHRYGGSGLGLAICRELLALMGGTIALESAVGRGSTFRVAIPCGLPAQADRGVSCESSGWGTAPRAGLRLLVAEDNQVNQLVIDAMLVRFGHQATIVGSGHAAVAAIKRERFDAVLMDISMPGLDGVAATRQIRALPGPVSRIPIVALTANAMEGDREAFLAAGMSDYISKPITIAALQALLERLAPEEPEPAACAAAG